jgi:hypothetical protein
LVFLLLIAAASLFSIGEAQAQREVQIGGAKRTANVSVYIGKSEDVRTDTQAEQAAQTATSGQTSTSNAGSSTVK